LAARIFVEQVQVNDVTLPDSSIFKAYDVRGIVDRTLTHSAVQAIGSALGSLATESAVSALAVGRDGRLSGPALRDALVAGIASAGIDVIDIGMVPTPVLYFATHHLKTGSGVSITGSHNPPEYNGLKMMMAGATLYGDGIQALRQRIEQGRVVTAAHAGQCKSIDVMPAYLDAIVDDVRLARGMKIAIDCGNGVAGVVAPELYRRLGCEVIELFCDVDGTFPNHHPDPSHPENLQDLIRCLRETDAEIGLAFDGDGDRLGVVTKEGQIIYPDRQIMLFAQDVLAHHPGGEIIFDVKCTRLLAPWIRDHGGHPTMWRTGHSLIKAKLKETGAPFAGEMSGHLFFNDRWPGFDDGLYAGARLLELLSRHADPSAVLNGLPNAINTPELQLKTADGENFSLVERLQSEGKFDGAQEIITIDGVRVEYSDGFGLARPSNTTPVVVMRFEGDNTAALERIQRAFGAQILKIKPDARLPFSMS
jgi:phosphomannomutase/phosphoglucomutase